MYTANVLEQSSWGVVKVHLFSFICFFFTKKKRKGRKSLLPSSTQCPLGLLREDKARAGALGEGIGVKGNGTGTVVHGEEVPNVPGPKAGRAQGGGMSKLQQGEA